MRTHAKHITSNTLVCGWPTFSWFWSNTHTNTRPVVVDFWKRKTSRTQNVQRVPLLEPAASNACVRPAGALEEPPRHQKESEDPFPTPHFAQGRLWVGSRKCDFRESAYAHDIHILYAHVHVLVMSWMKCVWVWTWMYVCILTQAKL